MGGAAPLFKLVGLLALVALVVPQIPRRVKLVAALLGLGCAIGLIRADKTSDLQQLFNGLFVGSIYALIALGYTMVYGVLRLINFAHGEVFMVGAMCGYFVISAFKGHPLVALPAALLTAMVVCSVLGVTIERCAYRPLRQAPRLAALITAIGTSLLLQNLGLLVIGAQPHTVPAIIPTASLPAIQAHTGLVVNLPQTITMIATVLLMLALQYVVARTKIGRAMRAVSEDHDAARLMGINVDLVISVTFIIGSALAGAGGVLYCLNYSSVRPDMGLLPGLKAFVAAVLGGIGSIRGAMIGAMLIGIIETFVAATTYQQPQLLHAALMVVMLVAFWRLGQQQLHGLPRDTRGNRLRVVLGLAAAVGCWVVSGLAGSVLAPYVAHGEAIRGSTYQDAAVFAILVVILIVKPTGLMGRYAPEKV